MKSVFIAAVIAAACSGVAMAGELKQDQNAPAVKAQVMSDSEMDKVTAGQNGPGFGTFTAFDHTKNVLQGELNGLSRALNNAPNGIAPGCGRNTITGC